MLSVDSGPLRLPNSAAICYLLLCQVSQRKSLSITLSGINHSGNKQVTQIQVSVMMEEGEENKEGGRKESERRNILMAGKQEMRFN